MTAKREARYEGKFVELWERRIDAALPESHVIAGAIQEGVRLAMLDHLNCVGRPHTSGVPHYMQPHEIAAAEQAIKQGLEQAAKAYPQQPTSGDSAQPVAPAPAPPPPPPAPCKAVPAPASNWTPPPMPTTRSEPAKVIPHRRQFTVNAVAMHGKGTKQEYLTFTMVDANGGKALLKFYRDDGDFPPEWAELLGAFVLGLGVRGFGHPKELEGESIELLLPVDKYQSLAGMDNIRAAIGVVKSQ